MARIIKFDFRVCVLDIHVRLPNGGNVMGAATKETYQNYYTDFTLYPYADEPVPEKGSPLYTYAKAVVEALADREAAIAKADSALNTARESALKAYNDAALTIAVKGESEDDEVLALVAVDDKTAA